MEPRTGLNGDGNVYYLALEYQLGLVSFGYVWRKLNLAKNMHFRDISLNHTQKITIKVAPGKKLKSLILVMRYSMVRDI